MPSCASLHHHHRWSCTEKLVHVRYPGNAPPDWDAQPSPSSAAPAGVTHKTATVSPLFSSKILAFTKHKAILCASTARWFCNNRVRCRSQDNCVSIVTLQKTYIVCFSGSWVLWVFIYVLYKRNMVLQNNTEIWKAISRSQKVNLLSEVVWRISQNRKRCYLACVRAHEVQHLRTGNTEQVLFLHYLESLLKFGAPLRNLRSPETSKHQPH